MALLDGPEHRLEFVNPAYSRVVGDRDVVGKTVAEALPDAVEQGYLGILDQVYRSGEVFRISGAEFAMQIMPGEPIIRRYLDFVYQPIRNADGQVTGIFVEGVDVTERQQLEHRRLALLELGDRIRQIEDTDELAYAASEVLGRALNVSRAGYGTINTAAETITIAKDWNAPGVQSIAGVLNFRDYGSYIEDLKAGRTAVVVDARSDPRTQSTASALEAISARAFVNMPVTEQGDFVALLFLNHETVREWPEDELAFVREFADRTRSAVERRRAEEALRELAGSLERQVMERTAERNVFATIVETTGAFIQVLDADLNFVAINAANANEYHRIFGVRPKLGDNLRDVLAHVPAERDAAVALWRRAIDGESFVVSEPFGDPALERRYYEMNFEALNDSEGVQIGAFMTAVDITQRLRAQADLADAQEALRQSQKMEAVGQLTGGIAHDFNNMLSVVIGSLDLLGRRLEAGDARARAYVDAATDGARRAAILTQRLLAFSRQQPLSPKPLDVNKLVAGMSELLRGSLGGDIQLETVLAGGLWRTEADSNQLENVILNLAVNARDAMAEGGRLTIETANAHLDARYVASLIGVPAGQYVMIAISDTGPGMSAEVLAKAFDPFFTTKGVGKGTGLGLSQVYGFVKQSGGHVKIYSEAGQGATVKVYLPRFTGAHEEEAEPVSAAELSLGDGREVILVVEDEPSVRRFSVAALEELGYLTLEADSAAAALRLLEANANIALLFTDIVMPEINGARLAEEARRRWPNLKVLFTTGYTRNAVVHNGVVDPGVQLIGKPFSLEDLAAKVRGILDAVVT